VPVAPGVNVRSVAVQHWSARGLFDRSRALWSGYVIEAPGGPIFFSGDTGLGDGWWVDRIRAIYPSMRLALLPIGAYEPRWFMGFNHMDPEQAVEAGERLRAQSALAIHFGTFPMADDSIDGPVTELKAALEKKQKPAEWFRTLEPGQSWSLPALSMR
jgi:L-ascorbate metabolism protein UlaG (beta-lactamase superfamily)